MNNLAEKLELMEQKPTYAVKDNLVDIAEQRFNNYEQDKETKRMYVRFFGDDYKQFI